MPVIARVPFLLFVLVIYNLVVLLSGPGLGLSNQLFAATLPSGALFAPDVGDLIIGMGILALLVEVLKATRTTSASVVDHALSTGVLIIFVVEFLVVPIAGTATFLLLTLMSLLDVVAGFTVTISTARRDIALDRIPLE